MGMHSDDTDTRPLVPVLPDRVQGREGRANRRKTMTTWISSACAVVAVAVMAPPTASAHHSFGAEYDVNQPITLTGVLTKIEYTNPHSHIFVDVKGDDGKVVNWQL